MEDVKRMDRLPIRVTIWNEHVHEREDEQVGAIYLYGIHEAIATGIKACAGDDVVVRTATLEQPEHGLTDAVLRDTDVLIWWGHVAHDQISDPIVDRVQQRMLGGMGLIALHSSQGSKIFRRLLGTTGSVRWREAGDREVVWTVCPGHPIAAGVPHPFIIPEQEMYGEYFDIPQPDELVFISSFSGGEVFRSGCCFTRGWGRMFYFSPGHEAFPVYHQAEVQRIITNAIRWASGGSHARETPYVAEMSPAGWFEDRPDRGV